MCADVTSVCESVMMQRIQKGDNALIVHHNCRQKHQRCHGNDDYASSLQAAHQPVGTALPC